MSQNYTTFSKLFLQFGTDKAIPETFGDYVTFGANRSIEGVIDLTKLSTTAIIISNTTFFPAVPGSYGTFIEKIELIPEVAATTGTAATLSIGLVQTDRTTVPASYGTALVNALAQTSLTPLDAVYTIVGGTTGAGGLLGSGPASATAPYYMTAATGTGTFTAGQLRVRILYHNLIRLTTGSNITQ